jgi:hypothetical protein
MDQFHCQSRTWVGVLCADVVNPDGTATESREQQPLSKTCAALELKEAGHQHARQKDVFEAADLHLAVQVAVCT